MQPAAFMILCIMTERAKVASRSHHRWHLSITFLDDKALDLDSEVLGDVPLIEHGKKARMMDDGRTRITPADNDEVVTPFICPEESLFSR